MHKLQPSRWANVNEFSEKWAAHVRGMRKARNLTKRRLAELAGCDPSLITMIELNGHIPRRDLVASIGDTFGDQVAAMNAAGMLEYAQANPKKPGLRERRWTALLNKLAPDALNTLELLSTVSNARQTQGFNMLAAYVTSTLKSQPGRKRAANA